jgi:hypothetical protein
MVKGSLYEKLKKEYPTMTKYVKAFPEAVQVKAFETLYNAYLADIGITQIGIFKEPRVTTGGSNDLSGVAELLPDGGIELTVRDPKAGTRQDAVKRVVYVTIRANELLTGKTSADKKKVVMKGLKKMRLTSGTARNALTKVPGLIKVGNEWSLDGPAKEEADKYIQEIKDDSIQGKFKPGTISRPKKKKSARKVKQK